MTQILTPHSVKRLDPKAIEAQVALCPALPSLGSINKALTGLLQAEQRYSAQISEVIRRDPSLTSRLLRLVNSVYYGLSTPVNNIEEAVFYLGVRQIRQLTMVTPIIEDFQRLTRQCAFPWREFWQHCIGTAMLTREILGSLQGPTDESDYVSGLVHDMGKIVMAWSFPEHFSEIHRQAAAGPRELTQVETEILGMDHAELGAHYLERHRLPELLVKTARFHHHPEQAGEQQAIVASVQIADLLMRNAKIGFSGNYLEVTREQCVTVPGWQVLFPKPGEAEQAIGQASLNRCLERLPSVLEGLV
ncbi:MAG TPA: HDOD domain-containing protein [Candidatus Sulfotelmatobacter sp.]|nr:HDOD domain-containing protein [Candidatus Sulfotelmatobacter sp.]HWI58643.1 HDOD domain-containing protein [Bacillota bacterium]